MVYEKVYMKYFLIFLTSFCFNLCAIEIQQCPKVTLFSFNNHTYLCFNKKSYVHDPECLHCNLYKKTFNITQNFEFLHDCKCWFSNDWTTLYISTTLLPEDSPFHFGAWGIEKGSHIFEISIFDTNKYFNHSKICPCESNKYSKNIKK